MDFMLEEEMIDLFTSCIQNPDASETAAKKARITEIGREIHADGGVDAMENFFFAVRNRIIGELDKDPEPFRRLWDGIDSGWGSSTQS